MATFDDVRRAANGRWDLIIPRLASSEDLSAAIAARGRKHTACPKCGPAKPGEQQPFRIFKDFAETGGVICKWCGPQTNGFSTLSMLLGISDVEARNLLADDLGLSEDPRKKSQSSSSADSKPRPSPTPVVAEPKAPTEYKVRQSQSQRLIKAWSEASSLLSEEAAPARAYYARRGIQLLDSLPEASVRFHPSMPYFEADDKGNFVDKGSFGCILAAVVRPGSGQLATLHRTYITPNGFKADVPEPKKLMTGASDEPITGGYIPLYSTNGGSVLAVTEGIETALAVRSATRMPVWSCVSAALLEAVVVPDHVKTVFIWADLDRSGRGAEAAQKLSQRLAERGIAAHTLMPQYQIPEGQKGIDWLDVLQHQGPFAFPFAQRGEAAERNGKRRTRNGGS